MDVLLLCNFLMIVLSKYLESWCKVIYRFIPLVDASVHVLDHPSKTDVQKSNLTVKVVNLLLKAAAAVSPPIKSNRPSHEIDRYNKTQRQDCMLWFTFILLENVHTRQGEQSNSHDPEEATKQHMQEIEEESNEERQKPVGK